MSQFQLSGAVSYLMLSRRKPSPEEEGFLLFLTLAYLPIAAK